MDFDNVLLIVTNNTLPINLFRPLEHIPVDIILSNMTIIVSFHKVITKSQDFLWMLHIPWLYHDHFHFPGFPVYMGTLHQAQKGSIIICALFKTEWQDRMLLSWQVANEKKYRWWFIQGHMLHEIIALLVPGANKIDRGVCRREVPAIVAWHPHVWQSDRAQRSTNNGVFVHTSVL